MYLRDMQSGEKGRIVGILAGEKAYRQKLIAMGLLPGTEFKIARVAPLGDPIEIAVRGYALSLRRDEARILQVEKVS
jgi:Fe2+ transport system protein FeoA